MSDDLIAQLRICANRGPGPFDPHWADSAKRLMRWAANALDAAEPAMRAEYERGRSEREQAAEPSPTIAHSSLAQKLWAESPVTERQGWQAAEPAAWLYTYRKIGGAYCYSRADTWDSPPWPADGFELVSSAPLYASPPKREPLSNGQIWDAVEHGVVGSIGFPSKAVAVARAVERAHGIGDE